MVGLLPFLGLVVVAAVMLVVAFRKAGWVRQVGLVRVMGWVVAILVLVVGFEQASEAGFCRNRPVLRVLSSPVRGAVAVVRWRQDVRACRREHRAVRREARQAAYAASYAAAYGDCGRSEAAVPEAVYSDCGRSGAAAPPVEDVNLADFVAASPANCQNGGLCRCGPNLCRCVNGECVVVAQR